MPKKVESDVQNHHTLSKTTPIAHFYKLNGIAAPVIRSQVVSLSKHIKQFEDPRDQVYGQFQRPSNQEEVS